MLPTIEDTLNLLRAICNDAFSGATGTPGEGQVLTDLLPGSTTTNPFVLQIISSAIRDLYRKLRIISDPVLIQDNYVLENLPVIDGPLGAATADPTIQTNLSEKGYFDGTNLTSTLKLPIDILNPIALWERQSGTTDTLFPVQQMPQGLEPRNQTDRFTNWEWRNGRIYFNGSTTPRDIRIRYFAQLLDPSQNNSAGLSNAASLYIRVPDCQEYVAYRAAQKVAMALGNPQINMALQKEVDDALFDIRNERTRREQYVEQSRIAYNDGDTAQELDVYGI